MAALDSFNRHCQVVARRLSEGKVIPFLGAGANLLIVRRERVAAGRLPAERLGAADYFARNYGFPEEGRSISSGGPVRRLAAGDATLFEELHAIFAGGYSRTSSIDSWRSSRPSCASRAVTPSVS